MEEKHECEACKNGIEHAIDKHNKAIETFGYVVHHVFGDPHYPFNTNVHSHGFLENLNHLDIQVCLPTDPQVLSEVFDNLSNKILSGQTFEVGKKYSDVVKDYEVTFAMTEEGGRNVLRMIVPDRNGNFKGKLKAQWIGCFEVS
jgi:hypothetical protein